ncbi:MAG: TraR/DksA family transcriptional regulator [Planctomycetia bacterium]|nr:TraR/DksA family transcriptional regulator [Planctomycetia bacterium]
MDNQERLQFKEKLLAMRARLRSDVRAMETVVARGSAIAEGEAGDDERYHDDSAFHVIENERSTLIRIERALERIEDGDYGECQDCCRPIPKTRLRALPYAEFCIHCAALYKPLYGDMDE